MKAGLAAALLFSSVAQAGSYGGADRVHSGFRISIDASVGSWSDHAAEAQAFQAKLKRANEQLTRVEPEIVRMANHYLKGAHPFAKRRGLVALDKKDGESVRVDVVMHEPVLVTSSAQVRVDLFVRGDLAEPIAHKLAADFALAQLSPGGALARITPYTWEERAFAEQLAFRATRFAHVGLLELLRIARQSEPQLRALASRSDNSLAVAVAQALTATFDGKSPPWRLAGKLEPKERARLIRLCVLLLPDGRFETGLAEAKKLEVPGEEGAQLREWLAGFARKASTGAP